MTTAPDYDPWRDRLGDEKRRLDAVNRASDYVRIRAASPSNSAPDRYIVTFECKGIVGIDSMRWPVYGYTHEIEIYCDRDFPLKAPNLKWITPIWHPNIQHLEPKNVCINKNEWLGATGLDWVCELMFDMVQYRNYHALHEKPFPLDLEVARWVLDFAEPNNIVNKRTGKFIDDRPFIRPGTSLMGSSDREPKLAIVPPPPVRKEPKIRFLAPIPTPPVVSAQPAEPEQTCPRCGAVVLRNARQCAVCKAPIRRVTFL